MRLVLLAGLTILLTGCAGWQTVQTAVATHGAQVADEALETAEWGVCEAPTVGAWNRRYGENPDKAEGWRKMCSETFTTTPAH